MYHLYMCEHNKHKQIISEIMDKEVEYSKCIENKTKFMMDDELFIDIEDQVCRLINQTHWRKFVSNMNELFLLD